VSNLQSFWTGGDFIGGARSGDFIDRSRPTPVVKIMGVDSFEEAVLVRTEYAVQIAQFWVACNTNHQLGLGDHISYRQRMREVELVYTTQAGQPTIEVWPDPVEVEEEEREKQEVPLAPSAPEPPILIERVRKGFVTRRACYETPINEDTFNNYPPSLWFTRNPPISPAMAGPPEDVLPNIAIIQAAYAALSPADAEKYQLSRIISAEWVDQNGNDRAGYVTLCRVYQTDSQPWEERPAVEFEEMGLLPVEPDAFGQPPIPPWFPDNYAGPWAPPTSPEGAEELLTTEPAIYGFWPNGTSATLHDFFGAGAPLFQLSIIDQFGNERFFTLGFGNRLDADPQGLPDEELTTCGFTFESSVDQDDWGHPLEDNEAGIQESKYWTFAPLTFWRPDGTEIVGPYPVGNDGFIPQEPPFGEMSQISADFEFWFSQL
jgi:hypothetical protein